MKQSFIANDQNHSRMSILNQQMEIEFIKDEEIAENKNIP
jgi:hypothetical protein